MHQAGQGHCTGEEVHRHAAVYCLLMCTACCDFVLPAVRHVEDIPFERIRPAKATAQEKKFTDMQAALQSADKQTIVGRCVALTQTFHQPLRWTADVAMMFNANMQAAMSLSTI